jgi:uncharacterized protein
VRVVIAGGTGFLGRKLAARLAADGYSVQVLTRRATGPHHLTWNPDGSPGDLPTHLSGATAIVNLAGEGVADRRWTRARKDALRSSRVLPTRTLAAAIAACAAPPRVFISGSAVGYYGAHGDEPVTERTPPGDDFLGRLAVDWEQEARAAESPATRVAIVRTVLVLAADGGALGKMRLPFKLGLGATLAPGTQYMPWIHVDDWTAFILWLIQNEHAVGAFNATAPTPVTNRTFTRALGRAVGRPAVFYAPAFVLRAALGEMAGILVDGQRALPAHAEQLGFQFTYRTLAPALESLSL